MIVNNFTTVIGKIIKDIQGEKGRDTFIITFTDGFRLALWHNQSCCECVEIDDIEGASYTDLIGQPLLVAEERSSEEVNEDPINTEYDKNDKSTWNDSTTWTFYEFKTPKGYLNMRWNGGSNGYYSERVDVSIAIPGELLPF